MRIAVMGTGGVGAVFGARLARGNDVLFIARGAHLEAIQNTGLHVRGAGEDILVSPADATADPAGRPPVDVVLFCVKLYDTETAAETIAPIVGPETRVITLQNGVEGMERLASRFGAQRAWGGVAYVSARIEAPGIVSCLPGLSRIVFGNPQGSEDAVALRFLKACADASVDAQMAPDILEAVWTKMILLATNAGISALSRIPIREFFEDDMSREVGVAAFREAEAVARARGVSLPPDLVDRLTSQTLGFPKEMRASMYFDLVNGKRLELDGLSGAIVRMGREAGIPTPVHATFHALLKAHISGSTE